MKHHTRWSPRGSNPQSALPCAHHTHALRMRHGGVALPATRTRWRPPRAHTARRGDCFAPSARPSTERLTPKVGWRRVPNGTTRVWPCYYSLWPAHALLLVPSGLPPRPLRRSRQGALPPGGPPPSAPRVSYHRGVPPLNGAGELATAGWSANTRLATALSLPATGYTLVAPQPRLPPSVPALTEADE